MSNRKNTYSSNKKRTFLKAAIGSITLIILFFVYSYYFGSMYGGNKYQLKSYESEAKVFLRKYKMEQDIQLEYYKVYDLDLHKGEFYKSKNFSFFFSNENERVKQYCPECIVDKHKFKLAAIGVFKNEFIIWSIDNKGQLIKIK